MLNNSARIGSSGSRAGAVGGRLRARRIEYFKFVSRLGEHVPKARHGKLAAGQVIWPGCGPETISAKSGSVAVAGSGINRRFGDGFEATLLLIELFLFTRLFIAIYVCWEALDQKNRANSRF